MSIFGSIIPKRDESQKSMTDEEFWVLELRRVDIAVTELLNEADNIVSFLDELNVSPPDVPVLRLLKTDEAKETLDKQDGDSEDKYALPGRGKKGAQVAFVGASPSLVDQIRGRPFSGLVGKTLEDVYVKALGLTLDDVYLTTIVKHHCVDDAGNGADPTKEQIQEAWPAFVEEMRHAEPRVIVALGKTVHHALSGISEEWAPHPRAINMHGDSGEVDRKMTRLAKRLSEPDETITGSVIIKSDDEKQIVYGVVMEPLENDTDGNWTTPAEIEDAAHLFMKNFRLIDAEHSRVDIDAFPVESWLVHEDTMIGDQVVKAGSWVMGVKVEGVDEWEKVKKGEYSGFSIDAFAHIDPNLLLAKQ